MFCFVPLYVKPSLKMSYCNVACNNGVPALETSRPCLNKETCPRVDDHCDYTKDICIHCFYNDFDGVFRDKYDAYFVVRDRRFVYDIDMEKVHNNCFVYHAMFVMILDMTDTEERYNIVGKFDDYFEYPTRLEASELVQITDFNCLTELTVEQEDIIRSVIVKSKKILRAYNKKNYDVLVELVIKVIDKVLKRSHINYNLVCKFLEVCFPPMTSVNVRSIVREYYPHRQCDCDHRVFVKDYLFYYQYMGTPFANDKIRNYYNRKLRIEPVDDGVFEQLEFQEDIIALPGDIPEPLEVVIKLNDTPIRESVVPSSIAETSKKLKNFRSKKNNDRKLKFRFNATSHKPYWKNLNSFKKSLITARSALFVRSMNEMKLNGTQASLFAEEFAEVYLDEALQMFSIHDDGEYILNGPRSLGRPYFAPPRRKRVLQSYMNFEIAEGETCHSFLERVYEASREDHLRINAHHPEHDSNHEFIHSLETLFDLLASACRCTSGSARAYHLMQTWIFDYNDDGVAVPKKKFEKLNPYAVLYFIAQVESRGLSTESFPHIKKDRNLPLKEFDKSPRELVDMITSREKVCMGDLVRPPKLNDYVEETIAHCTYVDKEMNAVRLPSGHDSDKFESIKLVSYTYHWFYPKDTISPTADDLPGPSTAPDPFFPNDDDPNPFSSQSSFTPGFIGTQVKEAVESMWNTLGEKVSGATVYMKGIGDQIISILAKMETMLDSIISNVVSILDKIIIPMKNLRDHTLIKSVDIIRLIVAYIFYCKCESTIPRIILGGIILNSLGLTDIIKFGIKKWNEMRSDDDIIFPTSDDTSSNEGVFSVIWKLFEDWDEKNVGRIVMILIMGFCAVCGFKKVSFDREQVSKKVIDAFKNMHFIGAGLFGLERIAKYGATVYKIFIEMLRDIFGKSESNEYNMTEKELKDLRTNFALLDAKIQFFNSNGGVEQIRNSITVYDEAKDVVEKMIQMRFMVLSKSADFPRDIVTNVIRCGKDVINLLNSMNRVRKSAEFRNTPFHIQLYGSAGIGKSTLSHHIVKQINDKYYPDTTHGGNMYSRNSGDRFWSGYADQKIVVVDEMYPILDAETLVEWTALISNVPIMLPMAELADKIQFFTSEWIVSGTNVPYPEANGVACKEAVWRRRHMFVNVKVDPRVINPSDHKFCKNLFEKYYPGQSKDDFPHLKFDLLKSVPGSGEDTETGLPFVKGDILPNGVVEPTRDLDYPALMKQIYSRRSKIVEEETSLPRSKKLDAILEVDSIIEDLEKNIHARSGNRSAFFELNSSKVNLVASEIVDPNATPLSAVVIEINEDKLEVHSENTIPKVTVHETLEEIKNRLKEVHNMHCEFGECIYHFALENDRLSVRGFNLQTNTGFILDKYPPPLIVKALKISKGVLHEKIAELEELEPTSYEDDVRNSEEYVRLERLIDEHRRKGNDTLADKMEMKKLGMLGGNIKPDVSTDPIGNRVFAFEYLKSIKNNGARIPQPDCDFRAHDEIYEDGVKFLLNNTLFEPFAVTPLTRLNHYAPVDLMDKVGTLEHMTRSWRHRFFLTSKDMKKNLWLGKKKDTGINLFYLQHIKKVNGAYYYDFGKDSINLIKSFGLGTVYHNPTCLTLDPFFVDSMSIFMYEMSSDQKDYLLACCNGKYRSTYSSYAYDEEWVKEINARVCDILVETPLWKKVRPVLKILKRSAYVVSISSVVIYLFRQLGALFTPETIETTSKKFFKKSPVVKGSRIYPTTICTLNQHEQHINIVRKNMFSIQVGDSMSNAVGVKGNLFVMNYHAIYKKLGLPEFDVTVVRTHNPDVEPSIHRIYAEDVLRIDNTDLVLVRSKTLGQFRDITASFVAIKSGDDIDDVSVLYNTIASRNDRYTMTQCRYDGISGRIVHNVFKTNVDGEKVDVGGYFTYDKQMPRGSSGGLVLNSTKSRDFILGIQCFTTTRGESYACALSQEKLLYYCDLFSNNVTNEGPFYCDEEISDSSVLINTDMVVLGSVPDSIVVGTYAKTKFVHTPISKHVPVSARIPAILDPFDDRVPVGRHPLEKSINKYGRDVTRPLDRSTLFDVSKQFGAWYRNRMINPSFGTLEFEDTIRGIEDMQCDPINLKTSPGIPWVFERTKPGKKSFISYSETGEIDFIDPIVKQRFDEWDYKIQNGVIPQHSSYEFPKDELRPIAKVNDLKTRSIRVLPFQLNLIYRKYHARVDAEIRKLANGENPICVGINPESLSWDRMHNNLTRMGDTGMDFDVGNWDGHFQHLLKEAVNVCRTTIEGKKIHPKIDTIRETLSQTITHGYVQFLDTVFQSNRGLGSGYAGTTDENCLAHCILLLYIIIHSLKNKNIHIDVRRLMKFVCFYVYGDDLVLVLSSYIKQFINYEDIIAGYEHYGWPITSADKGAEMKEKPICDLQFLKRSFKKKNTFGIEYYVGAIDKDVITDLLYWMRSGNNNTSQFYENLENAMEFAWFHGEKYYNNLLDLVNKALEIKKMCLFDIPYSCMDIRMSMRVLDNGVCI